MDAPHVYVRALALGCFHSQISTRTFRRVPDRVSGQLRGDKECPFSGVTKSGRVWRKVPESDARSAAAELCLQLTILDQFTDSLQQSDPEQGMVSMATPTHSRPPPLGVGLVHSRIRVRVPAPHDAEQEPHSRHSLHPPSPKGR